MKALITGVTGFIGSHLADYLLEKGIEVIGLVRWRSPKDNILHLEGKIKCWQGDLLDYPSMHAVINIEKPDIIFHLAAQSYVKYAFEAPVITLQTNIIGTCNLFEAVLEETGAYDPRICVITSSEVYGQVKKEELPIKETNPFRPASPYAVSKVGVDMLAYQYWLSWNMKIIRIRNFTTTGPRRGDVFCVSNFAKQIAKIEAGLANKVIHVGNLDSLRTFADVRDMVKAYWLAVEKCKSGEAYNVGGEKTMTVGEMLDMLLELSEVKNIEIEVDPSRLRPSDVTLQVPSVEKFQKETGWKPEIKFERTLLDTLDYWRDYYERNKV